MYLSAPARGHVLLVEPPEAASGLAEMLDARGWRCTRSASPAGVLRQLRADPSIDLVLFGPESTPQPRMELCRHIKFDPRTAFVSVIFVLSPAHADCRTGTYTAGADDCIVLPAPGDELLLRLSNTLRAKRATDSLEDATAVITSLANAIEGRDSYTCGHVERVAVYCVEIGRRVGVSEETLTTLRIGGIVHDIGKVAVPDHILNKPSKLTDLEMELIKRHPAVGYDILQPLRTFRDVLPLVRWHHERPNGAGYPDGLQGDQLSLLPRIVAVADVFDAISTTRAYRPAYPPARCRDILVSAGEKGDLDASLVGTLLDILDQNASFLSGPTQEPVLA
jgi:putative two-component system response regulator